MKSVRIAILFCSAGALILPAAFAQPGKGAGKTARYYDPAAETTISGTILDVQQYQRGRVPGVHLVLKVESGTVDVRLGPSTYISNEGFVFAKGDTVQILGAKTRNGAQAAIIAREVTKDGKKLILRDTTGRPLWAGAARRVTG